MTTLGILEDTGPPWKKKSHLGGDGWGVVLEDPLLSFTLATLLTCSPGCPPQPATQTSCFCWQMTHCWTSFLEDLGLPLGFHSLPVS